MLVPIIIGIQILACGSTAPTKPKPTTDFAKMEIWSAAQWESASVSDRIAMCSYFDAFVKRQYGLSMGQDHWCNALDGFYDEETSPAVRKTTVLDALIMICIASIPGCGSN